MTRALLEIDACFEKVEQGWVNPRPWFPTVFMFRAHGAFRAALGAAMSGQTFETFPLLRACLECGAYGLHIANDTSRMEIWLRRHDDSSAKSQLLKEFAVSRLRASIQRRSEKMLSIFDEMYERTIDFGAHPNERALLSSIKQDRLDDRIEYQTVFLHGDGLQLDHALKTTGQVGLWVLHAFQLLYPSRFMLLSIRQRLEDVRQHF